MKYGHRGNAKATTLSSPCGPNDLTFLLADPTGWPDGTRGPFWASLSKGQLIEEKVLCASRSGSLVQIWTDGLDNGRAMDDTTAQDHPVNAPVEHVWTATEAEEVSAHVNETEGAHGYPPVLDLVTVAGDQNITGQKTMTAPIMSDPVMTGVDITGGTATGLTSVDADAISVNGDQAEAEFRVRNTYIGSGPPSDAIGNDGDLYIDKG